MALMESKKQSLIQVSQETGQWSEGIHCLYVAQGYIEDKINELEAPKQVKEVDNG